MLEGKNNFLVNNVGIERFTLHVHPYVAAYINQGIISRKNKWQLRFGLGFNIIPNQKLAFLEYQFFDRKGKEINMQEEIEIR